MHAVNPVDTAQASNAGGRVVTQANVQWAVVTGASSASGLEFATALAARGVHLVLVARREAPMQKLAATLRTRHGIQVVVDVADLGEPNAAALLAARLNARGIDADILINNAAFGLSGEFVAHDAKRLHAMFAGTSSVVAGGLNRMAAFFAGWMPRHLLARLVFRFSKG